MNPATTFSSTLGYGWLSGTIDSRDRGALAGTTALTEDFDMTPSGTFAVNVPNGTYNVTVTLGDACYAHGPMTVSLQGMQVGSVSTAADQFAVKTYQVAVTTGQLDLGLVNAGSSGDQVCIDGLTIATATTTPPANTTGPHVTAATPTGAATAPVSAVTLTFNEAIQASSFTTASIDSLTGPSGAITPTSVTEVSSTQFTVNFAAQSAAGTYTLTVGPNILDLAGNKMDQNQDGVNGEVPQDEYTTTFTLAAPPVVLGTCVTAATPTGTMSGPVSAVTLTFSAPIQASSFTTASIDALAGPAGAITPTSVTEISSTQYKVNFAAQSTAGTYTLTVGPNILNSSGQKMDQNQNGVCGQVPQDEYTTTFTLTAPVVLGTYVTAATPTGTVAGPVSQVTVTFSAPIQASSFTTASIDSLTGPSGAITPTSVTEISSTQYAVNFAAQSTAGTYTLTIGPNILNSSGQAMDQNQNGTYGQVPQDEYTTTFSISASTTPPTIPPPTPCVGGLVAVTIVNTGTTTETNPNVRFAEVFTDGAVPAGSDLKLTLPDGTTIPYTAARENTWPDGSLRTADFMAEIPNGVSGPTTLAPGANLTLSFTAISGTFSSALPAGKTIANIITDIETNNAPIGVVLTGLTNSAGATVGSGTWVANSTTAFGLSGADGGYRCVATGPTVADFVAYMRVRDQSTGTEHPTLWAEFYITAFLNPTTGAVTSLCSRTWLNQGIMSAANDSYTFKLSLLVGNTTVRSWGFAADGRDQTFAPSAVNMSTSEIALPGNGFVSGEMVQFSSTGTLPAGLLPNTDYWVSRVDANDIEVFGDQLSAGTYGAPVTLTTQGTGTLTVNGYVQSLPFQFQCLAGPTGNYDWTSGQSTALINNAMPYTVHNSAYEIATGMSPRIDLSVAMTSPTQANPEQWAPGTNSGFDTHYGDTGARDDVGGVYDEWAAEALRYPADYAGYDQTSLVDALAMGDDPIHFVNPNTFQIPVLNAGTYAGLGATMTSSYYFSSANHSSDIPTPLGTMNQYTNDDGTHHTFAVYPAYIEFGGQDLLDLISSEANYFLMNKVPDSGYITSRDLTLGGQTYYTYLPSSEPRQDARKLNALVNAVTTEPVGTPQAAYFNSLFSDTANAANYLINDTGSSTWQAAGGWDIGELQKAGPGQANPDNTEDPTAFMQDYLAVSLSYNVLRTDSATLRDVATQEATLFINEWINFPDKAFNSSYAIMTKLGPGDAYTQYATWQDFGILDSGTMPLSADGPGGLSFAANGTVTMVSNGAGFPQIPLQDGDQIYLTTTAQSGEETDAQNPAPPQLQDFTWYYVRQAAANGLSFELATTDSDSTIITSYTPTANIAYWSNVQDRATNLPTLIYRHNGAVGMANGGYLTLAREACGYLYLAGLMPISGFQSADAFFQQENAAGCGPAGFSTAIFMSVAIPAGDLVQSAESLAPASLVKSSAAAITVPTASSAVTTADEPVAVAGPPSPTVAAATQQQMSVAVAPVLTVAKSTPQQTPASQPSVVDAALASLGSIATSSLKRRIGTDSARLDWSV